MKRIYGIEVPIVGDRKLDPKEANETLGELLRARVVAQEAIAAIDNTLNIILERMD